MLEEHYFKSFMRSLKKRSQNRRIWAQEAQTAAYRIFDCEHNVPLSIDIYNGKYAQIIAYLQQGQKDFDQAAYLDAAKRALYLSDEHTFYKERIKKPGRNAYRQPEDAAHFYLWTQENGLQFKVDLSGYLDSGLFLDHRNARQMIKEASGQKRVLNLFCYTGSFSVYAAAGGASSIASVDLSRVYLDWAKENMQKNGLMKPSFEFVRADANVFIEQAAQKRARFDIIVLDPPVFSNSRLMENVLDIKRDYARLINGCLKLLDSGGFILFSTPFTRLFFDPKSINGGWAKEITKETVPYDFRRSLPHRAWLVQRRNQSAGRAFKESSLAKKQPKKPRFN